jgi:hypothetical protein
VAYGNGRACAAKWVPAILDQFLGVVLDLVSQGHPEVLTSYLHGKLVLEIKSAVESELRADLAHLKPEEAAVLAMLRPLARCPPSSPPRAKRLFRLPNNSQRRSAFAFGGAGPALSFQRPFERVDAFRRFCLCEGLAVFALSAKLLSECLQVRRLRAGHWLVSGDPIVGVLFSV